MFTNICLTLTGIFGILIFVSFINIRKNKDKVVFTYSWAFLIGGFIWEDVLVFSMYGLFASVTTLIIGSPKLGMLFFLVFWVIRSAGETLYFFLQQFFEPKKDHHHYIENHFVYLKRILGPVSHQQCFVIMQVFFQTILITSVTLTILLLKHW